MISVYEEKTKKLYIVHKVSKHSPPHLHDAPEFVYVTDGTLELGIGQEFFHMEKGDFGIIFPDMIHHYQVFSKEKSKAFYIFSPLSYVVKFSEDMQKYCPRNPVIKKKDVHSDILNAIRRLSEEKTGNPLIEQAYIQIITARSMPFFELVEKDSFGSSDIIYQTVAYVAAHFKEEMTLDTMARELGVSRGVLSRVFSSTFHKNYNQYLNEQRLNYAVSMLECSEQSITDICLDSGFQSQRTFNRVFRENCKMTPREYRNQYRKKYITQQDKEDRDL